MTESLNLLSARPGATVALLPGCAVDSSLAPVVSPSGEPGPHTPAGVIVCLPDARRGVTVRWPDGSWSVCRPEQLALIEPAADGAPDPMTELEALRAKDAARDERAANIETALSDALEQSKRQTAALVALATANTPEERAAALELAGIKL